MILRSALFTFILFSFFILNAKSTDLSKPHGIEFGTSKKDAIKIIESSERSILEDEDQTKKIRRIRIDGSLVETLVTNANYYETRLEFFEHKLMSSSLFFTFLDDQQLMEAKDEYFKNISDEFGEASNTEKMLSYELWTWEISGTKILLSADKGSKSLKLEFLHEPIMAKKIEKEIDKKLYGEPVDPAKKTFIDGDYSRPTFQ